MSFSFGFFDSKPQEEAAPKIEEGVKESLAEQVVFEEDPTHGNHPQLVTTTILLDGGEELTVVQQALQAQGLDIGTEADIVPGVYEGGLKVWECSIDLCNYLLASTKANSIEVTTVLELGCGHALPALVCHRAAAAAAAADGGGGGSGGGAVVVYADYNREVLERVTGPNVALNVPWQHWGGGGGGGRGGEGGGVPAAAAAAAERGASAFFFAGDWEALSARLLRAAATAQDEGSGCGKGRPPPPPACYDLILASETLYTEAAAAKVHAMVRSHLSWPDGRALIASKRYYFGTGGSTQHFIDLVEAGNRENANAAIQKEALREISSGCDQQQRFLECKQVWSCDDGRSNIREILQVSWIRPVLPFSSSI